MNGCTQKWLSTLSISLWNNIHVHLRSKEVDDTHARSKHIFPLHFRRCIPVAKGCLMHEFKHAVNQFCDKAVVVYHFGALLGKIHITAQSKTLGDGWREGCGWKWRMSTCMWKRRGASILRKCGVSRSLVFFSCPPNTNTGFSGWQRWRKHYSHLHIFTTHVNTVDIHVHVYCRVRLPIAMVMHVAFDSKQAEDSY